MAWVNKLVLAVCMLNAANATYNILIGSDSGTSSHFLRIKKLELSENLNNLTSIAIRVSVQHGYPSEIDDWEIRTHIIPLVLIILSNSSIEPNSHTLLYNDYHRYYPTKIYLKNWGGKNITFEVRPPGHPLYINFKIEIFK